MLTTILRPDFALNIISRYTSGAQGYLSGADILLTRMRKDTEDEKPLARSIQNTYLIERAITENTVLNLNIHLNFLQNIFNKTVRELYESTARHIGMLEKRTNQAGLTPPISKVPRLGPVSPPYQSHSDFPGLTTVLEARQNQADTLSLVLSGKSDSDGGVENTSKPRSTGHAHHGVQSVQAVQPTVQTKTAEASTQSAGSAANPLKQRLPEAILNIPSWVRELWRIEPVKTALVGKNVVLTFPQARQSDIAAWQLSERVWAAWTSPVPEGKAVAFIQGRTREKIGKNRNETRLNAFLPKLPGLSHTTSTDEKQAETPHNMSRRHPVGEQTSAYQKEGNRIQHRPGGFPATSDRNLKHPPDMEHMSRTPLASTGNPYKDEALKQSPNRVKAAPMVYRTAEPAPAPSANAARVSWTDTQNTSKSHGGEADMLRKIWSYSSVPRENAKPNLNGSLFGRVHAPLFHGDRGYTPATDWRYAPTGAEHASIRKDSGKPREIPVSASFYMESSPIRSIMGDTRNASPSGMPLTPASRAQTAHATEAYAPFSAVQSRFSQAPAYGAPNQANASAALASGAVIVYRKEAQARQEPSPVPPSVSQDIAFIKKTVKRSDTSVRQQKANVAVNLPSFAANGFQKTEVDVIRDIERQAAAIADKVYNTLERRLRSEQMRKGLL